MNLISELTHFDARKAIQIHEAKLRDFAMIRNGNISIRSSIFSQYVLTKLIDTGFVIETMTNCMRNLDIKFDSDAKYEDIFKQFSRFKFVETAIAVEKRLVHMVKYFENIKELDHCRAQPLFWLQYAMCRLSLKQYREAERLFDVAYNYAKRYGYNESRHLDNQYARFLLESRTNSNEYSDYMQAFNKAHAIIIKQMRNEPNSYNPYRVAKNYHLFVERRLEVLQPGDLIGIFRSCKEVSNIGSKNKGSISNGRIVGECLISIQDTLDNLKLNLKTVGIEM